MENQDFILKLYMVPILENKHILNSEFDINLSKYPSQPLFEVGFHHFIHQSYELFNNAIKSLSGKSFYWVLNGFEILLSQQENKYELLDKTALYLGITRKEIESMKNINIFFQIWEILIIFNVLNKNANIHIDSIYKNEIQQSIDNFKLKITNKTKITYNPKSCNLAIICIDNYITLLDQEQTSYIDLMEKLVNTLNILDNNGTLILKLNDTFTIPMLKMIQLCKCIFDNVYIYKPYYVRATDSDKYLICINFEEKIYNNIKKKLEKSVKEMRQNDKFVVDFMSDIKVSKKLIKMIAYVNGILSGIQHKTKNKIMNYIKSDDYFGDEYQEAAKHQNNCVEYFLSNFFPINNNDYVDLNKKYIRQIKENNELIAKQ